MNHVVYLTDYLIDHYEAVFAEFEWLTMDYPNEDGNPNIERWLEREYPDIYKAWRDLDECSARYVYEDEEARDDGLFVRQDYHDDYEF